MQQFGLARLHSQIYIIFHIGAKISTDKLKNE